MKYKKFRDLKIDITKVPFTKFSIKEILNYMPAGNDVIEIKTKNNQNYIIKIERSKMADFLSEFKNINYVKESKYDKLPSIVEFYNKQGIKCLVEEKVKGKRLSEIINSKNKDKYLYKMGYELAIIHNINCKCELSIAKQRVINQMPYDNLYCKFDGKTDKYLNYLKKYDYKKNMDTFIHGDYHYGNILWYNGKVASVLDWEYSGKGHKEQDIAWALCLRPQQKFLNSLEDIKIFLDGYKKLGEYDSKKLKWCLINGYLHFYLMNKDINYKQKIIKLMEIIINVETI